MEHKVHIVERTLSDGSKVHDVVFGDVLLPAVTERDAAELAQKIQFAVHDHTNESVEIVWPAPPWERA